MTAKPDSSKKRLSRRGALKHAVNPFIGSAVANTKTGVRRITDKSGTRMMVVSEATGEIIAPAGFWQAEEVDRSQFVKLYINGVKAFRDLTSAGTKVFELLYIEVQNGMGKDRIYLSFHTINQAITPMSESTFMRGMRELVAKGFIAESLAPGWYFLNPDYMWNGDRLAFVKEYRIKDSSQPAVKHGRLKTAAPDLDPDAQAQLGQVLDQLNASAALRGAAGQWTTDKPEEDQILPPTA